MGLAGVHTNNHHKIGSVVKLIRRCVVLRAMAHPVPNIPDNYGERIDFKALEKDDEDFRELLASNKGRLDWKNPVHVM
jgi:hypothetical protein